MKVLFLKSSVPCLSCRHFPRLGKTFLVLTVLSCNTLYWTCG